MPELSQVLGLPKVVPDLPLDETPGYSPVEGEPHSDLVREIDPLDRFLRLDSILEGQLAGRDWLARGKDKPRDEKSDKSDETGYTLGRSRGVAGLIRLVALFVSGFVLSASQPVSARELSFEDRVKAQEAIERVYFSHQIGVRLPFDRAVPRSLIERKVRNYLRQAEYLGEFWHSPVTEESLRKE